MPQSSSGYRSNSIRLKKLRSSKYGVRKKQTLFINSPKYIKLFSFFILSTISFVFLLTFFINKNINKSFAYAGSNTKINSDFYNFSYISVDTNSAGYTNIEKINFILVDKITKKTLIIEVPLSYKTDIGTRFTDIELKNLINIAGINSKDKLHSGVLHVNNQIFKILGFRPENFIVVDSSVSNSFEELIYKGDTNFILNNFFEIYKESKLKSNLNLLQILSIQQDLNNRVSQDTKVINLSLTQIENTNYIDSLFDIVSLSSQVASEKKTISVLNGTKVSGLAGFGSRVLNNNGGRVVFIDNAKNIYDNSVLITDDLESATTKNLLKTFNITKVYTKDQVPLNQEDSFKRSDVTLILGVDFINETY